MLNLNSSTLQQVAEKAAQDAAQHPRWLTAIGRALVELDCNPWIARNDHGGLTIGSPSGECYAANGVCQCKAYEHKIPCWHRAAARLVRLHDEALERQQAAPQPDAQRIARKIAAQRATAVLNELFA
jgi:hypothetical protein